MTGFDRRHAAVPGALSWRLAGVFWAAWLLVGCASPVDPADRRQDGRHDGGGPSVTGRGLMSEDGAERWEPFLLPGKPATRYRVTTKDGRWAIEASADHSASMLRRVVDVAPDQLQGIAWSWWVDAPLALADLGDIDRTDAPAQLVLAFDGDKSRLPMRTRMMFDLARALTGEEPPYATLVYAWSTNAPLESIVQNPRSDRVRKIVVDSGSTQVRRWREHRRDIVADYQRVFGEAPGRLIGVALMTDADNTRDRALAWYGRVCLLTRAPAASSPPMAAAQPSNCSPAKS